ncbi:plasmid replication protein RepC [Pseudophaeobacter sp.]|uniref:plasmid replication protein RepC n=1 Tax=Pseudophaeobacter sp. TaxID=1971739 RepID=UPI00405857D9
MSYIPVTPFRRTVEAAVLKHHRTTQPPLPDKAVNKWEVLRELAVARERYGLSDRDMNVLQALVSFHQATTLGEDPQKLVVFPSNKAICERLNGMPNSTMRRHLARLVGAGIIIRRDSPNGKRYQRSYGSDRVAFGFDLSPMVRRFQEFSAAAEDIRNEKLRLKRLRETVSLMRRDLAGLAEYGAQTRPDLNAWDRFSDLAILTARDLRRKLDLAALSALEHRLLQALTDARNILEPLKTTDLSTNESENEQHHQNSNIDSYESERVNENNADEEAPANNQTKNNCDPIKTLSNQAATTMLGQKRPNIPLPMVLSTCTEFLNFTQQPVRHWHELVKAADALCPMMGIGQSAWLEAKRIMGPEEAAVVLVALLERFSEIKSPGGYMRSLSKKAVNGAFSSGPMIMALIRKEAT